MINSKIRLVHTKENHKASWKENAQTVINEVITSYYSADVAERTPSHILQALAVCWDRVDRTQFNDILHYYTVLAKTTDYLLQWLLCENSGNEKLHITDGKVFIFNEKLAKCFVIEMEDHEARELVGVCVKLFSNANSIIPARFEIFSVMNDQTFSLLNYKLKQKQK